MAEDNTETSQVDGIGSRGNRLTSTTTSGQRRDDETYKMDHKNRGFALIFNHQYFEHPYLKDRLGTDKDGKALSRVFQRMNFKVEEYDDLTKNEIFGILDAIAKEDHSDNDCLVIAIMSHGEKGGTLFAKDAQFSVDSFVDRFSGKNCPSLAGKPKLFFIQACRGDKTDSGNKIRVDAYDSNIYSIPVMADILIMYATVEGYYAWRDTVEGSWFVQSLVEQLENNYQKRDLLSILTMVNRKVAVDYVSRSAHPDFDKKKEMCSIVSMLTRDLYFH